MKLYAHDQLKDAFLAAERGEQVLLISKPVRHRAMHGRILDHDTERLWLTARRFGVRHIVIQRAGLSGQNVELKNAALYAAINECQTPELAFG